MKALPILLACAAAFVPACSPAEEAPKPAPAAPAAVARNRTDRAQFSETDRAQFSEVLVTLSWDDSTLTVHRKIDGREFTKDDDLASAIKAAHDAWAKKGKPDAWVTIDADARVPWKEVTNVVEIVKRCGVQRVEFAMGEPVKQTSPK
jgi:biopolymer transport protein ExbD